MHRNSTMIVWDNKINYLFKFQEISNWSLHWRENCMCMENSNKNKKQKKIIIEIYEYSNVQAVIVQWKKEKKFV